MRSKYKDEQETVSKWVLRQISAPGVYNKIALIGQLFCMQMLVRWNMKRREIEMTTINAHEWDLWNGWQ